MNPARANLLLWAATVILGAFSGFSLWLVLAGTGWTSYILLSCFVGAAILLMPSIWHDAERSRSFRIVAAVVLTAVGFMTPIQTHAVKLAKPVPHASQGH